MSGHRSLSQRLRRVREWEAVRDDGSNHPGPFDVKAALTGVPEDYAVRRLAFVFGDGHGGEYLTALSIRDWLIVFRAHPERGNPIEQWRRHLDAADLDARRAGYARAAQLVADALRGEVNGELVGLGTTFGQFGADARMAAGAALVLAREWEGVASVAAERLPTVNLDRLPPKE